MKAAIALMIAAGMTLTAPAAFPANEDSREDREALRKEMQEARREMAEAARRVAELGRKLGAEAGDNLAFRILGHGEPRRAMLGIAIGDGGKNGVEVLSVTPGGPADKAGIQAGDAIIAIGKKDLAKAESPSRALVESLHDVEPGSVVAVKYRRGNDDRSANVTVEEFLPRVHMFAREFDGMTPPLPGMPRAPMFLELMHGWGDIELASISPELGAYFGTDKGLLVIRAPQEKEFKLQDGDVILSINGREPEDPAHAMRILRSYRGGETLKLDILRKEKKMSLEVDVPERRSSERVPFRIEREAAVAAPAPL